MAPQQQVKKILTGKPSDTDVELQKLQFNIKHP
jgi:hypothetical protein